MLFRSPQSEPSILVGHIADPKRNAKVLDACAAPGLKATHLAQLVGRRGRVAALDIHEHRIRLINENSKRLSLDNIETYLLDARDACKEIKESFDLVLVDAPCSGTGVLNRRADARWRKKEKEIAALSKLQKEILKSVIPLTRPGGNVVYSTCSLEPEENQEVIDQIIGENRDLEPVPLDKYFSPCEYPVKTGDGVQFLPQNNCTEGFYIAKLVKIKGTQNNRNKNVKAVESK